MQIISGACLFIIASILLAYVPGKLLLVALKRTLRPLEEVTLACVLGLVVSGVVYWLMTFAHQGRLYLLWPVGISWRFVNVPSPDPFATSRQVGAFLTERLHAFPGQGGRGG